MGLDDRYDELHIEPQRRTLDEVRAQAAVRRAKKVKRGKIFEGVGVAVTVIALAVIAVSSLAVVAAIIGGAYWLLTGHPIFGG